LVNQLLTKWSGDGTSRHNSCFFENLIITEEDALEIGKFFYEGFFNLIQHLWFTNCQFNGRAFEMIIEKLYNKNGPRHVDEFRLTNLSLSEQQVSAISILNAYNIGISNLTLTQTAFDKLAYSYGHMDFSSKFHIYNQQLTKDNLISLVDSINRRYRRGSYLKLTNCGIKDISPFSMVSSFMDMLSEDLSGSYGGLIELDLEGNEITLENEGEIDVFRNNKRLLRVSLARNKITKGVLKLLDLLKERRDILSIDLGSNPIGDYAYEFIHLFDEKRALESLNLQNCSLSMDLARKILEVATKYREKYGSESLRDGVYLKKLGKDSIRLLPYEEPREPVYFCGS
jgi:hypothetical protein